jgi:hypothetical protein
MVANGLGQRQATLNEHQIREVQKVILSLHGLLMKSHLWRFRFMLERDFTYNRVVRLCITTALHSCSLPCQTLNTSLPSGSVARIEICFSQHTAGSIYCSLGHQCRVCNCIPMPTPVSMGYYFWQMFQWSKASFSSSDL